MVWALRILGVVLIGGGLYAGYLCSVLLGVESVDGNDASFLNRMMMLYATAGGVAFIAGVLILLKTVRR